MYLTPGVNRHKKSQESQERKEKLLFNIEEKYFHYTFPYLAGSLGAAQTTLSASANVKEQQRHQGLFGSLNPSRCHAESGHKLSVTCIYNLILPVTNQRPHDHRPGKHGSLRRKQSSEWCPDWQSNTLHCFLTVLHSWTLLHWITEQTAIYLVENNALRNRCALWAWHWIKINAYSLQKCKFMQQKVLPTQIRSSTRGTRFSGGTCAFCIRWLCTGLISFFLSRQ